LETDIEKKRDRRGIFVTFEGIEGSGKTTLIGKVGLSLREKNLDPLLTREPGGTGLGLALRNVLLDPEGPGMENLAELMLFGADRAQHVAEVIRPALAEGRIVLCDRFSQATMAYQGFGRGLCRETVDAVDKAARGEVRPDLIVLLDLPVEAGLARVRKRNFRGSDLSETRIDEEELSFHQRVREGYLQIAREDPERHFILDARRPSVELSKVVISEMSARFPHAL